MTLKKYMTKKGVRWRFEIMLSGERHSKSGLLTKHEAMEAEIEHRKLLSRNANNMALKSLMIERYDYLKKHATNAYFKANQTTLNNFFKSVGDVMVTDIAREQVEDFLSTYKGDFAYNYALKQLRALFNLGVERCWTEHNPTKGVQFIRIDKKLKYVPPKEHMDTVINITSTFEEMAFLMVLKHTLARSTEIYNLKWEDVDLNARQITLWTRKKRGGVKTPRHLTINDNLYQTLSLVEQNHEYVFWCKKTGKKYVDRKKLLFGLCADAKVKRFTLHSFRHFGASQLAMKGVSLPEIQMILGHDNVITTSKYIQSLGINKTEAINLLD